MMIDWQQKGIECGQQALHATRPSVEQEEIYRMFFSSFMSQFPANAELIETNMSRCRQRKGLLALTRGGVTHLQCSEHSCTARIVILHCRYGHNARIDGMIESLNRRGWQLYNWALHNYIVCPKHHWRPSRNFIGCRCSSCNCDRCTPTSEGTGGHYVSCRCWRCRDGSDHLLSQRRLQPEQ